MKWKDKRDVLLLSTKHTDAMVEVPFRGETNYNKGKSSIDISDQMASYNSALRKTIKWYRKVAIEVLFGTTMVNAYYLYKKINNSKMVITEFREQVIEKMMFTDENQEEDKTSIENNLPKKKKKTEHKLERKEGLAHKIRKYCVRSYKKK